MLLITCDEAYLLMDFFCRDIPDACFNTGRTFLEGNGALGIAGKIQK